MTKEKLFQFIKESFCAEAEYLWEKYPEYAVFRHKKNKKWFAIFMPVDGKKLSQTQNDKIQTITLKCEPSLREALLKKEGVFPAYHMNKNHWISVDIAVMEQEEIKTLIDISFSLTE